MTTALAAHRHRHVTAAQAVGVYEVTTMAHVRVYFVFAPRTYSLGLLAEYKALEPVPDGTDKFRKQTLSASGYVPGAGAGEGLDVDSVGADSSSLCADEMVPGAAQDTMTTCLRVMPCRANSAVDSRLFMAMTRSFPSGTSSARIWASALQASCTFWHDAAWIMERGGLNTNTSSISCFTFSWFMGSRSI